MYSKTYLGSCSSTEIDSSDCSHSALDLFDDTDVLSEAESVNSTNVGGGLFVGFSSMVFFDSELVDAELADPELTAATGVLSCDLFDNKRLLSSFCAVCGDG